MDILFLLIPVSLIFLVLVVGLFIWAVNHQQFEDLDRHGHDILFDNDKSLQHSSHHDEQIATQESFKETGHS